MQRIQRVVVAAVAFVTVASCAGEPDDDAEGSQPLVKATVTDARPEIGILNDAFGSKCTATLIAERWVLTAAHCVAFSTANPGGYSFFRGSGTQPGSNPFAVQRIFNFGPSGFTGDPRDLEAFSPWTTGHLHITADGSGNDDIALLLLASAVVGIPPADVATTVPASGTTVTDFGYGCNDYSGADDKQKRYASWTFGTHPVGMLGANDGVVINADGTRTPRGLVPDPGFLTGGHICSGDSGGPAVAGGLADGGAVWGVNSLFDGTKDTFGAVAFLHGPICRAAYSAEPHSPCVVGAALVFPPGGCASSQSFRDITQHTDAAIRHVCGSPWFDTFCCSTFGSWDLQCVNEARTAVTSPASPFGSGSGSPFGGTGFGGSNSICP